MTIEDIRHRNLLVLIAELAVSDKKAGIQALADRLGRSHSQISQLKTRAKHSVTGKQRNIGSPLARAIETSCGKPTGWMDEEHPPMLEAKEPGRHYVTAQAAEDVGKSPVAQSLNQRPFTLPDTLSWEALMRAKELPPMFVVQVPDDALAPNLPRGTSVVFEVRERGAQPGECVLVEDSRGGRYMRRFVQGVGHEFVAQALNDAYVSLHSERDGLRILAVMAWRGESRI